MRKVVAIILVAVGLVHLAPVVGVFGAERLAALYGVEVAEPNLLILMRHRAVLFGVLGGLMVAAAFLRPLQPAAIAAGLISTVSFVVLALLSGGYNAQIRTVVWVDVVLGAALVAAAVLYARIRG